MAAAASSRKLVAGTSAIFTRSHLQPLPRPTTQPLIPFSSNQQRKLLESKLASIIGDCTSFSKLKQVHAFVYRRGFEHCCYVISKLVRASSKLDVPMDLYGSLVIRCVREPNPFLWTSVIRGYCLQGEDWVKDAILMYKKMRFEGVGPVTFTFCALLKACGDLTDLKVGWQLQAQTVFIGGFESDLHLGNVLIDMYVRCGDLGSANKVFDEMAVRDVISWTSLIVAYGRSGDMGAARGLFERMDVKDRVAWSAMVTGYAQNAKPKEALGMFEKMWDAGVMPDEVTLVGAISACAQLGVRKDADWIRDAADMFVFGDRGNVVLGSALIDMYAKCGSVEDAYMIFEGMRVRNVYTYSSMIAGFAMHGQPGAALQLFEDMLKTEIVPNDITFLGVLTACSHAGMVKQGRQLFAEMKDIYGIEPTRDHYACMADLLSRAGHLDEVLELIRTMPMEPSGGVWGALLGACHTYGHPDIAGIAASNLFDIEPNAIGNYVMLCNIYASAGKWDDFSRIRKIMLEKGMKKNPGCSQVEDQNVEVH